MRVYIHDLGSYEYPINNIIDWDEVYKSIGVDRETNYVYDEYLFMLSVVKYGIEYVTCSEEEWQNHQQLIKEIRDKENTHDCLYPNIDI